MEKIDIKYSTTSLQNMCLITLIEHLEHYPPELLACIPPTLRYPLLLHIPIADLCQLERTRAADGVDVEMVWRERFQEQVSGYINLITNEHNASLTFNHLRNCTRDVNTANTTISNSKSNREMYLETISSAIFKCARPTGYYRCNGCDILALDKDYLKHSWLFTASCFPVDIVNYLVAAVKIKAVSVTREPSIAYTNKSGIEFENPIAEYELQQQLTGPIDRSSYARVNELFQYVPQRYVAYLNKMNDYHLSEENALILLMEKCNYYPEVMHISVCRYDVIHWSWEYEKRKSLVGQFLSKSIKMELNCSSDYIYDGTAEQLRKLLEDILCTPSPQLSSLFLVDVKDDHILAIAPSLIDTTCNLQELSVDRIETESSIATNELGNIITSQSMLSSLSLVDISPCSFDVTTRSQFAKSIYSFVQKPHFENLSLCGVELANDVVQEVITAFLTSPCSHAQCVKLRGLFGTFENPHNKNQNFAVPDLALGYKSLEISLYSRLGIEKWLLSLQPLKLKSLNIHDPYDVLIMS